MRAHIHILFAAAFVLLFNLLVEMNLEVNLILAAIFFLLPDIDEPNSIFFADMLTVSGTPLAYPWSEKKFVALGGMVNIY